MKAMLGCGLGEFGATKKQKILESIAEHHNSMTEKAILQNVGDNRYSREIIRNLLQNGRIHRQGTVWMPRCTFYADKD